MRESTAPVLLKMKDLWQLRSNTFFQSKYQWNWGGIYFRFALFASNAKICSNDFSFHLIFVIVTFASWNQLSVMAGVRPSGFGFPLWKFCIQLVVPQKPDEIEWARAAFRIYSCWFAQCLSTFILGFAEPTQVKRVKIQNCIITWNDQNQIENSNRFAVPFGNHSGVCMANVRFQNVWNRSSNLICSLSCNRMGLITGGHEHDLFAFFLQTNRWFVLGTIHQCDQNHAAVRSTNCRLSGVRWVQGNVFFWLSNFAMWLQNKRCLPWNKHWFCKWCCRYRIAMFSFKRIPQGEPNLTNTIPYNMHWLQWYIGNCLQHICAHGLARFFSMQPSNDSGSALNVVQKQHWIFMYCQLRLVVSFMDNLSTICVFSHARITFYIVNNAIYKPVFVHTSHCLIGCSITLFSSFIVLGLKACIVAFWQVELCKLTDNKVL